MGYAVVFSGMLGHVFWYEGLEKVGVAKSMVYIYFIPIWAVVFNALMMERKFFSSKSLGSPHPSGVHWLLRTEYPIFLDLQILQACFFRHELKKGIII